MTKHLTTLTADSFADKCMLADLSISAWTGVRHDKKVSEEVADRHNVETGVGRYNKVLIEKSALAKIMSAEGEARREHFKNTLPWSDDGYRILPASNFLPYQQVMMDMKGKFDMAVAEFVSKYPIYVEDARKRLNGLFREGDYPKTYAIRDKFGFRTKIMPLPSGQDFRVKLHDDAVVGIRQSIEQEVGATMQDAIKDVWERIYKVVGHMVERLKAYSEREAKKGKKSNSRAGTFKDTLVENIAELAEVLPRLNISGDPLMDQIAREMIAKLCTATPEALREDANTRDRVTKDAQAILDKMAGYIGDLNKAA